MAQKKKNIKGTRRLLKFIASARFAKLYAWSAAVFLLLTVIFWAFLSAHVNLGNADQLVDSYMMSDFGTFQSANFPGAHTFLFKWPLFWLVQLFGASAFAFVLATILVTLVTVGALAFVLFRIERRPLMFGTLCLVLASTLFLVPIQPYAGALLPVNMAMLATRNLEYVLYMLALVMLTRAAKIRTKQFWLAVGLLALLVASDKLFLVISAGGAVLALLVYALIRRAPQVQLAARWLLASALAGGIATLVLFLIDGHLTHFANAASVAPYSSAHTLKEFAKAAIFSVIGVFSNLGANPAFDTIALKEMPVHAIQNIFSFSGVALLVNVVALAGGCWAAIKVTISTLRRRAALFDNPAKLSVMLVCSTVAAMVAFVLSAHFYPVDARYVTIAVFALFVAGATWLRQIKIPPQRVVVAGIVVTVAVLVAIPAVLGAHHADTQAMATANDRNKLIASALQQHHVDTLVGDYWRVVPTKLQADNQINILPLSACLAPQTELTSGKWRLNLDEHSFAYLLTFDGSLTGYSDCSLQQVIDAYGRPNTSTLVAGTLSNPLELLLFYDKGAHKSAPATTATPTPQTATVLPIKADQLPYLTCTKPTDMNIVAHQDDDLLFMNPDVLHALRAGHCMRTVYITAGDAGGDSYYWVAREHGVEAAYSRMIGSDVVWIERIVQLGDHQFATVANPRGVPNVSLIFLHLPDGGPSGHGFTASHQESLQKLHAGLIQVVHSVDHQSSYTAAQLTDTLVELMRLYQPAQIRTQSSFAGTKFVDHSDHIAVGEFAKAAHAAYQQQQFGDMVQIPMTFYVGYPIHESPENVHGQDLEDKVSVFLTYAAFDGGACHTQQQCDTKAVYGAYLRRQYTKNY